MLHCPTCGRHYTDGVSVCPEDSTPLQADSTVRANIPIDPLIGRVFDDKYRLDARLGAGGMGTVYHAMHLLIDRPVAIKVLNPRWVEDEEARERFRREARAAGRLQHTNAVAVTDFGRTADGYVYIVMELLEGRTLRELLAREAPLDVARAVSLMLQTSAAVAAAHEAGIIHRDLKPGNIFIVERKNAPPLVKVLDFGIAKIATDSVEEEGERVATLTQIGAMIGTPRYMSPEQCDGAQLTAASDVYSLGIILYEMMTGSTPFNGTTPLAIAMKHSREPVRPPREIVQTIPQPLEDIVLHALEKLPDDRPRDAGEFRRELFDTAESLGLEHSSRASFMNFETLRGASSESPSGKLVVDMSLLRERQATNSAERKLTLPTPDRKPAPQPVERAPQKKVAYKQDGSSPVIARLTIPLQGRAGKKRFTWLRGAAGITLASVVLLFLIVIGVAFWTSRQSESSINGNTAAPSPSATPTPSPIASPSPHENSTRQQNDEEERKQPERDNKPTRRQERRPASKPGKLKSMVNQVKKIFKNPF